MADLDIEAMLEAPFEAAKAKNVAKEQNGEEEAATKSSSRSKGDKEKRSKDDKKDKEKKRKSRSRSRDRDREREKDKSKEKREKEKEKDKAKDKDRDREKEKEKEKSRSKRKSRSRSRSRSRDRRRRSRSRSRSRSRDRSTRRRHSRSRSRDRRRRTRSRSRSRDRRRSRSRSRSRDRRRSRSRSRSRDRRRRDRTPETENEKKIREYIESLSKEDRAKLDDEIDRTERSLICMQLSVKLRDKELIEFFMSNGVLVRDARIIQDRNSGRSKGIAYVELLKKDDMQRALGLSGQKIHAVPILIQYSQAEKNRQAGQTTVGPTKIYVSQLHNNLSESDVKNIFSPFGDIESVTLQKDNSGRSQGICYINFKKPDYARLAIEQMNGFELAGMKLKVGWENEKHTVDSVDDETDRGGVALTSQSRLELMQKLAQSKDVGMPSVLSPGLFPTPLTPLGFVPGAPAAAVSVPGTGLPLTPPIVAPAPSQCLKLRNMFDPNKEKDEHWAEDLEEDVEEEAANYGKVVHIHVDRDSKEGAVYLKYDNVASATTALGKLNGRWFDGQMIIAEYVPVATYAQRFPNAK